MKMLLQRHTFENTFRLTLNNFIMKISLNSDKTAQNLRPVLNVYTQQKHKKSIEQCGTRCGEFKGFLCKPFRYFKNLIIYFEYLVRKLNSASEFIIFQTIIAIYK